MISHNITLRVALKDAAQYKAINLILHELLI